MQKDMSGPVEDKIITIPADKMAQINKFIRTHNKQCGPGVPDVCCTSKYLFTFRPSGLGDNIHIVCDCGQKYYPDAGDEDI